MPSEGPVRLHPLSLVRGISLRELAQAVPGALVAASALGGLGSPATLASVAAVLVGLRVLAYLRHTYHLTGDAIVEQRGLLRHRDRTLDLDRIQQVEVEQGLLDRLLGTAVVRLETAAESGESELELRVVSVEEAERLRASLPGRVAVGDDATPGEEVVRVPIPAVALAAVTGPRLLAIPVLVGGLVGILFDLGLVRSEEAILEGITAAGAGVVATLAVAALVLSVLAALVVGVLRDGDFRIDRIGGELHVRRGLVATRAAVVPVSRLQQVVIHRSAIHRLLGVGTLVLYSAGGAGDGASFERRLRVPLAPDAELRPLALRLLGDAAPWPAVQPHPKRARPRVVLRWWWRIAPPTAVALLVLTRVVSLAPAVVPAAIALAAAVATGLGILEHRHLASGRNARLLVARSGATSMREVIAPTAKVQGTAVRSSPFQRRRDLATLVVHIAGPGGAVTISDVGRTSAVEHQSALDLTPVSAGTAAP